MMGWVFITAGCSSKPLLPKSKQFFTTYTYSFLPPWTNTCSSTAFAVAKKVSGILLTASSEMIAVTWYWHRLVSQLRVIIFTDRRVTITHLDWTTSSIWGHISVSQRSVYFLSILHLLLYPLKLTWFYLVSFSIFQLWFFLIFRKTWVFIGILPRGLDSRLTWSRLANCQSRVSGELWKHSDSSLSSDWL